MEHALYVLLYVAVLVLIAFVAHYIIVRFFPADLHMPVLLIVGVILLIVLLVYVLGWPPRLGRSSGP